MIHYVLAAVCFCIIAAALIWSTFHANKTPEVKSHDAIDEEIRREKIACHNTSLDYAELQLTGAPDPLPHFLVAAMLSSAFKSGARWQARQP